MNNKQYYVTRPDQTQEGPYDEEALIERHKAGKYPNGTLIWCEGMRNWSSLNDFLESYTSSSAVKTPPHVIPPTQGSSKKRRNVTAGVFAILLWPLGVHKFYNGSWGWGAIYLGLLIIWFVAQIAGSVLINSRSAFAPLGVIFIPFILLHFGIVILSIIEGIMYLTNEQKYNLKYNETSPAPMKW